MLLWMITVAGAIAGENYMRPEAWFWLTIGCYAWHVLYKWAAEKR